MGFQLAAFGTGAALSIMISVNGNLSDSYGVFLAAVIIHLVGTLFGAAVCAGQKEKKPLWKSGPKWIYLGGALGVAPTVCNNLAYGKISLTAIVALGLFGQTLMSLLIDRYGLLGGQRRAFRKSSLIGLAFALVGIAVMLDRSVASAAAATGISVFAGAMLVVQRMVNARLSDQIGALRGSLVNHITGLPVTILLLFTIGGGISAGLVPDGRIWIYLGGTLGVTVVMLSNLLTPRLPAFTFTVMTFLGQIFSGTAIDLLFGKEVSTRSLLGGMIIAVGVAANMAAERIGRAPEGAG